MLANIVNDLHAEWQGPEPSHWELSPWPVVEMQRELEHERNCSDVVDDKLRDK